MSRTFLYSDPHFGHTRVIEMGNRPFDSIEHMNNQLIKNWNNTVSKGDTIYVLGDISFYLNKEETHKIISQLKGKKILILGNHDRRRSVTWWLDVGFHTVMPYPILFDWKYLLSHEPVNLHPEQPFINIHGHLHGGESPTKQHFCVSVEQTKYRPINLDKIKTLLDQDNI